MADQTFEPGELVFLKSDKMESVPLIVEQVHTNGQIGVTYFSEKSGKVEHITLFGAVFMKAT